jgi:hypothetical protein
LTGKGEERNRPRIEKRKFVSENEEEILPSAGLTPRKPIRGKTRLGNGMAPRKFPLPAVFLFFRRLLWKSLKKSMI